MPSRNTLLTVATFVAAALIALAAAWWATLAIESRSAAAVRSKLLTEGVTWAEVRPDGLKIRLGGTAPNEAARFRVLNMAASVVQASRLRDDIEVTPLRAIEAPQFSVEILRNDDSISLIGLMPSEAGATDENAFNERVLALAGSVPVSDMIETAGYPAPENWEAAVNFGLEALRMLPRAKISIAPEGVTVTAIATSADERSRFTTALQRRKPKGVNISLDISAPRPVLTPFTLRFVKDAGGVRFDACAADTEQASARIRRAAHAAGVNGRIYCELGLGVPTPRWAEAAEAGIQAVARLDEASITFSDADVTFTASADTAQADFDRAVGELQRSLPAVFSLQSILPPKDDATLRGPAEFTAELAEDGRVRLYGRLTDSLQQTAVDSFARAQFGANRVYTATRLDPELPEGWPVRVLAGLQSLGRLSEGNLKVRADMVELSGVTGDPTASDRIAQLLADRLGQGQHYSINLRYDEALDPNAALPSPQECLARLNAVQARNKISFPPGSTEIEGDAVSVIAELAGELEKCPPLELEIAGHTDSQGSEGGNQSISQARAEAVLAALIGRRVDAKGFVARGYGESDPIADNSTEAGREANRRITFALIGASAAQEEAQPNLVAEARAALRAEEAAKEDAANAAEPEPQAELDTPPAAETDTTAESEEEAEDEEDLTFTPSSERFERPRTRPAASP